MLITAGEARDRSKAWLNCKPAGHAIHPTVTPCQHATYWYGLFGSWRFPLNSGPSKGQISGHSNVVAGFQGSVVTQSSEMFELKSTV